MFGVSPAYFFSRFSTDFTVEDIALGLPDVRKWGFEGFQLEIYHLSRLREWEKKKRTISKIAHEEGLTPTQFVGHLLLYAFNSLDNLRSDFGIEEIKRIVEINMEFPLCKVITVPIPPFEAKTDTVYGGSQYTEIYNRLVIKVAKMQEIVESSGLRMALEILPFSLVGNINGFKRLCNAIGTDTLGYNFDTGHAMHCKENLPMIPAQLWDKNGKGTSRIYGTHFKDTGGLIQEALTPGQGVVPWKSVLLNLRAAGYQGPLDLEIVCPPSAVLYEYQSGLRFLKEALSQVKHTITVGEPFVKQEKSR